MDLESRTVIVLLDGTPFGERALSTAIGLAASLQLPLELVHVREDEWSVDADAYLSALASTVDAVDVKTRVEEGPLEQALSHVTTSDVVVCMASHGHGGVVGVALGRVADDVLRRVPASLVLVGPHATSPAAPTGGHLVVCFDGSPNARAVLPMVRVVAATFALRVHVAMVLHRHAEFLGNHDATEAKRDARELVDELVEEGLDASLDLLDGLEPARALARFAEQLPAAFIATASHGAGGVVRTIIGSTALRIVHHAPCPVIVRRPRE